MRDKARWLVVGIVCLLALVVVFVLGRLSYSLEISEGPVALIGALIGTLGGSFGAWAAAHAGSQEGRIRIAAEQWREEIQGTESLVVNLQCLSSRLMHEWYVHLETGAPEPSRNQYEELIEAVYAIDLRVPPDVRAVTYEYQQAVTDLVRWCRSATPESANAMATFSTKANVANEASYRLRDAVYTYLTQRKDSIMT